MTMKKILLFIALALSLNSLIHLDAMESAPIPATNTNASAQAERAAQRSSATQQAVQRSEKESQEETPTTPQSAVTRFQRLIAVYAQNVTGQKDFTYCADAQSYFMTDAQEKEKKEYSEALIKALKEIITLNGDRFKLDVQGLESVIGAKMAQHFIMINPKDFVFTDADKKKKTHKKNKYLLECLKKIAQQASQNNNASLGEGARKASLFQELEEIVLEYHKASQLIPSPATSPRGQGRSQAETKGFHEEAIVIDTRSFCAPTQDGKQVIRTDVREMLDALRVVAQKPSVSSASSASNPNEVINQQLDQARDRLQPIVQAVHKNYPQPSEPKHWTSTWKGHLFTAAAASTVTLCAVYGALKISGFKLTPAA